MRKDYLTRITCMLMFLLLMRASMTFAENTTQTGQDAFSKEIFSEKIKVGTLVGTYKKSQAIVSVETRGSGIGEKNIPVYEIDGALAICVEDLQYYGYHMNWNPETRVTRMVYDGVNFQGTTDYKKSQGNIYYSDIDIYIGEQEVDAYNIGGFSLVKVSDLFELDSDLFVRRKFDQEEMPFELSGSVILQDGQRTRSEDIKGKVIVYTYGYRGRPVPIAEKDFLIPSGQNSTSYAIGEGDLSPEAEDEYLMYSYAGFQDKFISYQLASGNDQYIDLKDGLPLDYEAFVIHLDPFKVNYADLNIQIFKKATVQGLVEMDKKIVNLGGDYNRVLKVTAIPEAADDQTASPIISKMFTVPQIETSIEYDLDVIADRAYKFKYELTRYHGFPPKYGMWIGPSLPLMNTVYYNINGNVSLIEDSSVVYFQDDLEATIDILLPVPEGVAHGCVYQTDIQTFFEDVNIRGINVDGYMAVYLKDIEAMGYEVIQEEEAHVLVLQVHDSSEKSLLDRPQGSDDTLVEPLGEIVYSNLALQCDEKEIPAYRYNGDVVILADDLALLGFKVKYSETDRALYIETIK